MKLDSEMKLIRLAWIGLALLQGLVILSKLPRREDPEPSLAILGLLPYLVLSIGLAYSFDYYRKKKPSTHHGGAR